MFISNFILAFVSGIAIHYYLKIELSHSVIFAVIIFMILSIITEAGHEGFIDFVSSKETRAVRYGDSITIWSWKNAFSRVLGDSGLNVGPRLSQPEEIPRGWVGEHFVIEDSRDPSGPGNRGPVKYGDTVYIRTWRNTWISPRDDGNILQHERGSWEKMVIESPDVAGTNGSEIQYGDMFYLKTWRKTYVSIPESSDNAVQLQAKDKTCIFRIYDRYGQGQNVDWARRGSASQSSGYGQYPAVNAIDGNFMTFSHTQNQQGAWWQVRLPKEVYIDKIVIKNRKDCCQDRIVDSDVMVMDSNGTVLVRKHIGDVQPEYTFTGINRIGRIVRVQLRKQNYLHLGEVQVYGKGVDYSTLLENPIVSDIMNDETNITENSSMTIFNEDLPFIDQIMDARHIHFLLNLQEIIVEQEHC